MTSNYDPVNKEDMISVREEMEGIGYDTFKLRGEGHVMYL